MNADLLKALLEFRHEINCVSGEVFSITVDKEAYGHLAGLSEGASENIFDNGMVLLGIEIIKRPEQEISNG